LAQDPPIDTLVGLLAIGGWYSMARLAREREERAVIARGRDALKRGRPGVALRVVERLPETGPLAAEAMAIKVNGKELALGAMGPAAVVFGSLFLLAFFTFHFGLFHFVHSVFLKTFLPIEGYDARSMPGPGYYWAVVRRYWLFLPLAFLAERQAFRLSLPADPGKRDTAVTAGAIAERQAGKAKPGGMNDMMAPYKNVVRMHLLIFFFAFAHFAKLESFLVYAVVYAAYFFPWRLLGKKAIPAA